MAITIKRSEPLNYVVSAPPAGPARPVLVFLHGYDEGAPTEIRAGVTRHGPLRPGSSSRARDFIVVAPQLPLSGDHWLRFAGAVRQITADVTREHGGDPSRTYLTGFSFGGNGVFDLALAEPDAWSALWAVDPTRAPRSPIALPVWVSAGEVARQRRSGFVAALDLRDDGDRVWRDRGLDHVGSATDAYRQDEVYDWLLTRVR